MKTCSKCKAEKDGTCFGKNKNRKDGLSVTCKDCLKQSRRSPEALAKKIAYDKGYRELHKPIRPEVRVAAVGMKICTGCKLEVSETRFGKDPRGKNGLMSKCMDCKAAYARNRRASNPNAVESERESGRRFYDKNREVKNATTKRWQSDNKERHRATKSLWSKANRDEINQKRRSRYQEDPVFKLEMLLRSRIYKAISRGSKMGSGVRDLGCTVEEFKTYIEGMFILGMTWDNWKYEIWHLDHIIPLAAFDLTDREQFLKAVHYTNLQPLWAKDNQSKGAKLDWRMAA